MSHPVLRTSQRSESKANIWVVVLAAGAGKRLHSLTTTAAGVTVPKQFCALHGGPSLLDLALSRGAKVSWQAHLCTIVAAQHRRWWSRSLGSIADANIFVQPENRGTANGILLPLLHILSRDPDGTIVLLPSDHYVENEVTLTESLREAVEQLADNPHKVMVLGIGPESADPELGYIVPAAGRGAVVQEVERFVEKPAIAEAQELIEEGGLWNSFILAGRGRALLGLFERRVPDVVARMSDAVGNAPTTTARERILAELYSMLPMLDFSRDIMQGQESSLCVLSVLRCGWSDLGTPRRVAAALERPAATPKRGAQWLSLADQYRSQNLPARASLSQSVAHT